MTPYFGPEPARGPSAETVASDYADGMIDFRRAAVISAAESWIGTPYHHMGRLKGVGCDCLTLLAAVYHEAGVVPAIEIPFYSPDWHLHRSAERYMEGLLAYAREVDAPRPGDSALFRFGRCFAHGAIVVEWPRVIHAWNGLGVVRGDASKPNLSDRSVRFFSPFLK
jgi:NlpC/P60 family putative phage cell wall peptidase